MEELVLLQCAMRPSSVSQILNQENTLTTAYAVFFFCFNHVLQIFKCMRSGISKHEKMYRNRLQRQDDMRSQYFICIRFDVNKPLWIFDMSVHLSLVILILCLIQFVCTVIFLYERRTILSVIFLPYKKTWDVTL